MLDRLQSLEDRYNKLNELLSDPNVISDPNKLREYSKEQSDLEDAVIAYREYILEYLFYHGHRFSHFLIQREEMFSFVR